MNFEPDSFAQMADLATILGVPIAAFAIIYGALQLRHSARTARGQFLLEIEEQSTDHDEVHRKLYPHGDWGVYKGGGPGNFQEWGQVADYLGFFEQCESLIRSGCLDKTTFKKIYGYRIKNILDNQIIVKEKLQGETRLHYELFISLCKRLGYRVPEKGP